MFCTGSGQRLDLGGSYPSPSRSTPLFKLRILVGEASEATTKTLGNLSFCRMIPSGLVEPLQVQPQESLPPVNHNLIITKPKRKRKKASAAFSSLLPAGSKSQRWQAKTKVRKFNGSLLPNGVERSWKHSCTSQRGKQNVSDIFGAALFSFPTTPTFSSVASRKERVWDIAGCDVCLRCVHRSWVMKMNDFFLSLQTDSFSDSLLWFGKNVRARTFCVSVDKKT